MAIEQTALILKPDALKKGVQFEILERFRKKGFDVIDIYQTRPSEQLLRLHYAEVIEKEGGMTGENIIAYINSGPVLAALLEGNNAVEAVRNMCGTQTEPGKCPPGTIRHDYGLDSFDLADPIRSVENLVHSSDSVENAQKEKRLWFSHLDDQSDASHIDMSDIIANAIGYKTSDMVKEIITWSNEYRLMYHGIKDPADVAKVKAEGIKPLTPEAGPCSFWSTGLSLFYPFEDSTFFRYSGRDIDHRVVTLDMAVTHYDLLKKKGMELPDYESDSNICVPGTVLPGNFVLLTVPISHRISSEHNFVQTAFRKAEWMMLHMISSVIAADPYLAKGYAGRHITYDECKL